MAADAPPEVDAVIAVGANLGDRAGTMTKAVLELAETFGIEVSAVSPIVETIALRPSGPDPGAPRYLNAVVLVRTFLSPEALLAVLHDLERSHGRERTEHWGDRTLDLDIVSYGDLEQQTDNLTLPHPRAYERDFVLRPWLAVDPDAVLPGRGRVAELLAGLEGPA
jgi:2-amino-4-hydroxy-6-hydroxymethyldihydropteridine diphosphokinase